MAAVLRGACGGALRAAADRPPCSWPAPLGPRTTPGLEGRWGPELPGSLHHPPPPSCWFCTAAGGTGGDSRVWVGHTQDGRPRWAPAGWSLTPTPEEGPSPCERHGHRSAADRARPREPPLSRRPLGQEGAGLAPSLGPGPGCESAPPGTEVVDLLERTFQSRELSVSVCTQVCPSGSCVIRCPGLGRGSGPCPVLRATKGWGALAGTSLSRLWPSPRWDMSLARSPGCSFIAWPAASLLPSAPLAQTWTPLMGLLVWGPGLELGSSWCVPSDRWGPAPPGFPLLPEQPEVRAWEGVCPSGPRGHPPSQWGLGAAVALRLPQSASCAAPDRDPSPPPQARPREERVRCARRVDPCQVGPRHQQRLPHHPGQEELRAAQRRGW